MPVSRIIVALIGFVLLAHPAQAVVEMAPPAWTVDQCVVTDPVTGDESIDAERFFETLIARYQALTVYQDVADVMQIASRDGEKARTTQTRIGCAIDRGALRVDTATSVLRRELGLNLRTRNAGVIDEAKSRYDLWMAPHMTLRFAKQPRQDFRVGAEEKFVPSGAKRVTIDDRELVQVDLQRGKKDDDKGAARFRLFVNPESMLVERIEGNEQLADGTNLETEMTIAPRHAASTPPASGTRMPQDQDQEQAEDAEHAAAADAKTPPADEAGPPKTVDGRPRGGMTGATGPKNSQKK